MAAPINQNTAVHYCERLGKRIAQSFRSRNHHTAELPAIAFDALAEDPPAAHVSVQDVCDYLSTATRLPPQGDPDTGFGEPSLTLYSDEFFRIDLLVWRRATTSIHQHGFTGAFTVLQGSSIQTTYEFKQDKVLSEALMLGNVGLKSVDELRPGHVEIIPAGESLIHSVFHLDVPSATFLVRSHNHLAYAPQLSYERPFIARDPFSRDETTMKRVHTFRYLLDVEPERLQAWTEAVLENSNQIGLYEMLGEVFRTRARTRTLWNRAVEKALECSPELTDKFVAVMIEQERERRLWGLRKTFRDRPHRVCLAALLSAEDWRQVHEIISRSNAESASTTTTANLVADVCASEYPSLSTAAVSRLLERMFEALLQPARPEFTALAESAETAAIAQLSSCEFFRPLWSPKVRADYASAS